MITSRGVVSSLRENDEILQIDFPINLGNFGGPVIDRTGCVVGVATFKLEGSEGLNFAVFASRIPAFLAAPTSRLLGPEVNPGPPKGAPHTCWFQMKTAAKQLQGFYCRVKSRLNINGHTAYDVVQPGCLNHAIVLWHDEIAEMIINE